MNDLRLCLSIDVSGRATAGNDERVEDKSRTLVARVVQRVYPTLGLGLSCELAKMNCFLVDQLDPMIPLSI